MAVPLRDSLRYLDLSDVDHLMTMPVRKLPHPLWQYAIPGAISIVCGVFVGVLVTRGGGTTKAVASTTPAQVLAPAPAPAAAPVVTVTKIDVPPPVVAPAASPMVGVTFQSTPPGATVTLVDNGRPSYIGTTPVEATIDATHRYDIVYTLDGFKTRVTPLDPSRTRKAEARLDTVVKGVSDRRALSQGRRHHH
jgi:hypothetical protein